VFVLFGVAVCAGLLFGVRVSSFRSVVCFRCAFGESLLECSFGWVVNIFGDAVSLSFSCDVAVLEPCVVLFLWF
jgi:hypothetical protein